MRLYWKMALLRAPNFCILITFGLSFYFFSITWFIENRKGFSLMFFSSLSIKWSPRANKEIFVLYSGLLGRTKKLFSYIWEAYFFSHTLRTLIIFLCNVSILSSSCLDEEREEKVWERGEQNVIVKCFVTISKVSPSPPSDDWHDEEVSSEFLVSSMKKPEVFSRFSLKMSFVMPSPTPSTPRGRLSPPWMLSMLWNDKARPSTDLEVKHFLFFKQTALLRANKSCIWYDFGTSIIIIIHYIKFTIPPGLGYFPADLVCSGWSGETSTRFSILRPPVPYHTLYQQAWVFCFDWYIKEFGSFFLSCRLDCRPWKKCTQMVISESFYLTTRSNFSLVLHPIKRFSLR